MNSNDYEENALRTEFTPDFVRLVDRLTGEPMSAEHNMMVARLIHGVLGLASEVGEIADALKKLIIYGKALDQINVMEEVGDLTWYEALILSATRFHFTDAFERNIAKLKKRFGDKFSEVKALNRDLPAERAVLEKASKHMPAAEMISRIMAADGVKAPDLYELLARKTDSAWLQEVADGLEDQNYHGEAALVHSLIEAPKT